MNRWGRYLMETAALHQRLIARYNRISLPRGCSADERLRRLRQALIHQRTLRVTYFTQERAVQQAVQHLSRIRGGIAPDDLVARYGPVRPWKHLWKDPTPQSVAETLLLLGWLFPRPMASGDGMRYLVPPSVRQWLPQPVQVETLGPAPSPPDPPILRAAVTLLLLATEQTLPVRRNGHLRQSSVRLLTHRLAPWTDDEVQALGSFLVPLLYRLELLERWGDTCRVTMAGHRFLAASASQQHQRLLHAWYGLPQSDGWLTPLLPTSRGIVWPVLRRRLAAWVGHLPMHRLVNPADLHDALEGALGPLADPHTHGYRTVDRRPWQPRRSAAVFDTALRGPLRWLGIVAWAIPASSDETPDPVHPPLDGAAVALVCPPSAILPDELPLDGPMEADVADDAGPVQTCGGWHYGEPGLVHIPHTHLTAEVLRLLPFATWHAADATTTTYRITAPRIAQAITQGYSDQHLWAALTAHAGTPPDAWLAAVHAPMSTLHIHEGAVLLADDPAVLDRAARARSVRRYIQTRVAPGIALVEPEHIPALTRALNRQHLAIDHIPSARASSDPPPAARTDGMIDLTPSECATLLVACAAYRQHAPPDAPLVPTTTLEARLADALTPALREATDLAVRDLRESSEPSPEPTPPPTESSPNTPALLTMQATTRPDLSRLWLLLVVFLSFLATRQTPVADEPASSDPDPDPPTATPDPATLSLLTRAIRRRDAVAITYTDTQGTITQRTIRPFLLEPHGDWWYVRAYCALRRRERLFRVDRIERATVLAGRQPKTRKRSNVPTFQQATNHKRDKRSNARTLERASFFPIPTTHEPGRPRVWLE